MTEISVEAIEQAISVFYNSDSGRQKAHEWLSSIQHSQAAWQFAWSLISQEKSQTVQFFGVSTLQTKILKHWFEVPPENVGQLRSQLLEKIFVYGSIQGGRLIANKLCLSLGALILHTVHDDWATAITDIIATFQSYPGIPEEEVRCRLLLEVLTGLPDQYRIANYGVQGGKKAAVYTKLTEEFQQIHNLLSSLLEQNIPSSVKENTLRCITSWVEFGIRIDQLGVLVNKAFSCLYDSMLFETAVDTLVAALTKNEPYRYPTTLQKHCEEIVKIFPLWQTALAEENMEWCRDICRLVVNFAEENANILLNFVTGNEEQQKLTMGIVSMIMAFTDVKGTFPVDESLSDLSFGFWYILQDLIVATTDQLVDHYMAVFSPIYIRLVDILLRKVQYPEDNVYQAMSTEEREQFRCYRQDIGDTVMYVNCMLRERVLLLLGLYIARLSQRLPDVRWQEVESVLYVLSNVTEESLPVDEEEWEVTDDQLVKAPSNIFDQVVVDMVDLISKLKIENKMLLISVLEAIGAFSEYYEQKPELLSIVFPVILLHGLNSSETILSATTALKDICKDNASYVAPYSAGILNVCHHKLQEGTLLPRNAARLLSCVGHVLSHLPYDTIVEWLNKFLPPITESLSQAALATPSSAVKMQILDKLQMLTFLFDSLDVKRDDSRNADTNTQPVLVIMKDLLPGINSILSNWVTDGDIVECVVEMLKKSLHTLLNDFIQILEDVCLLLVKMYEYMQHTAILDIIKQLVLLFIRDAATYNLVRSTFHSVAHKTLEVLRQDPHSKTDLLEAYMNLCVQMSKKSPNVILEDGFPFGASLEIAVVGVSFPEAPTMKASCSFLSEILSKKAKYTNLDSVIGKLASQLYDIMLKSIGGAAPRANIEYMTPIFLAMNVMYFEIATRTMNLLLNQENYPVHQPTAAQKSKFIKDVLRERSNKRRLKESIAQFSMICRGIAGTEYAQQTAFALDFR